MRIGIDLGGSKIEAVLLQGNSVVSRQRVATPQGDYQASLAAIAGLVAELERNAGVVASAIGLGHPGSICPHTGLLRNANSTCLNGRPLQQDLQAMLGRDIACANDANCLALSELYDGAAMQDDSVFCVILGTGVGGALALNRRLHTGHNALAGEWGHNPLPWPEADEAPGERCWCGQNGCLETWLSGPALSSQYHASGGPQCDVPSLLAHAKAGESLAQQCLARYSQRLARALAAVINLLDPQKIILAGGLSQMPHLYDEVPALWQRWVFADRVETVLVPAMHGDSSGVLGAARLEL